MKLRFSRGATIGFATKLSFIKLNCTTSIPWRFTSDFGNRVATNAKKACTCGTLKPS